jgi:hypothetical protein
MNRHGAWDMLVVFSLFLVFSIDTTKAHHHHNNWNIVAIFWAITATNLWLSLAITYNAIGFILLVNCALRLDRLVEWVLLSAKWIILEPTFRLFIILTTVISRRKNQWYLVSQLLLEQNIWQHGH